MSFDYRKYGLYAWSASKQEWLFIYFGFKQVLIEVREQYRTLGWCTCMVKKTAVEYNAEKDKDKAESD